MSKYIIRVEENEEEMQDGKGLLPQDAKDGVEADGFVLLTCKNGEADVIIVHHITCLEIAKIICKDGPGTNGVLHQAIAIAEGVEKAKIIERKYNDPLEGLSKMLKEAVDRRNNRQEKTESAATE